MHSSLLQSVSSEEQSKLRKIGSAVIKKMVREERMLVVVEEGADDAHRLLRIHPNYAAPGI